MIYDDKRKDKMISFRVNKLMYSFLKSIPNRGMSRFLELSIMSSRRYSNFMSKTDDE